MEEKSEVQCHYEVLGIPRDANAATIKKAHRTLALKHHPDKSINNDDSAAQFRLVQAAYECLSDPTERAWYDEHRQAILKGWSGSGETTNTDMLFDVEPYMHPSCYQGFEDTENGFFAVYQRVFAAVRRGELQEQEFDINHNEDDSAWDFGTAHTPWEQVAVFYQLWDSFASCLNYSWADPFNVMEAPNRRIRRGMEEENRKARRTAKRARNDEILALVRFVKRRDPRVQAQRQELEQIRIQKEKQLKQDAVLRKNQAQQAREQWRQEAEETMAALEEEDRVAGRVRLADLDDDYDYGGKKGKKGKNKKKGRKETERSEQVDDTVKSAPGGTDENAIQRDKDDLNDSESNQNEQEEVVGGVESPGAVEVCEESEEESEEPDIWRCECCKKDFKSEGQMENHMRSKKHKEAWKKYQAKVAKLEKDIMEELLNEGE